MSANTHTIFITMCFCFRFHIVTIYTHQSMCFSIFIVHIFCIIMLCFWNCNSFQCGFRFSICITEIRSAYAALPIRKISSFCTRSVLSSNCLQSMFQQFAVFLMANIADCFFCTSCSTACMCWFFACSFAVIGINHFCIRSTADITIIYNLIAIQHRRRIFADFLIPNLYSRGFLFLLE